MKRITNHLLTMALTVMAVTLSMGTWAQTSFSVTIDGAERMTFGPTTDTPHANAYTAIITGTDGTVITEDNASATDFKVTWDIEGFKTENDTEGQYCDSYGAFSVNNEGRVKTTFDLRDVPMNFFGRLTATVTYNGSTVKAGKYVVALGDLATAPSQVLPLAGYPADFINYPDALTGYSIILDTYGAASDLIIGGWSVAGSDSGRSAKLQKDADGTKYVRFTASTTSKSHVMTQKIDAPASQLIFSNKMRFNNVGAVVTLTGGNPFWLSNRYSCPVSLNFDGTNIKLNGTTLTSGNAKATISTGRWYKVVVSADKTCERCYALVFDADGQLVGESGVLPWAETSTPTYFSVGMGNSSSGTVDLSACEAHVAMVNADSFTLTADKPTLSIPQGESVRLTATANDANGYAITQKATWTVLEADMQQSVIITPDTNDSHTAIVTPSAEAEAGTVTIQVSIGGTTKTIALSLTSSAEGIKFTQSTNSITIPMSADEKVTTTFAACVVDGEGNAIDSTVALAAYDRDNKAPYTFGDGISFDAATGVLSVTAAATPAVFCIRATSLSSTGTTLTKSVRVNVHGMKFDFGYTDDDAVAEGYTAVGSSTAYTTGGDYGIASGRGTAGGTPSATDATSDYLQGTLEFDFKALRGSFYEVEVTYQGMLTTGHINSDLTGYELGTHTTLTTDTYLIPATISRIDLHVAPTDATTVARIAQVSIVKQAQRKKRQKRVVHHIGDSTSANNGSWAYRLKNLISSTYPELYALCDFHNDGAGGRNLSTYYAQGRLGNVLRDIYPDDIVMFGNNGTNGMGNSFESDMNYYLNAAEALGAKIIINSYTPHGAVSNYANGYNTTTHTFNSYRKDSYETVVRRVAQQRAASDANYLGFVEIGQNADAIFNAYVADYAANGYASANAAAQAIIACFTDHNHYSNGTLACDLMLNGYGPTAKLGIVPQLQAILENAASDIAPTAMTSSPADSNAIYTLSGQRVASASRPGLYIRDGRKEIIR